MEFKNEIIRNLNLHADSLEEILRNVKSKIDDLYSSFYQKNVNIFNFQNDIKRIRIKFLEIGNRRPLNNMFNLIVANGLSTSLDASTNSHWFKDVKPIVEAWNHSVYILESLTNIAFEYTEFPQIISNEISALLYLYNIT